MKQPTALTWLRRNLELNHQSPEVIEWLFGKAMEKEREQSIRDYCEGFKASDDGWNGTYGLQDMDNIAKEINAEQYFTDTYLTEP